jgi:glutathione S-transferase|tara:strand:- start:946 stop:1596 length:651 start_codon:yes stop_codon:yes gene_type:complete
MDMPILYSFKRCPYAMRARLALKLANIQCELREVRLNNKPKHMLEVSPKGTVPILILEDKIIDESIEIINWVLDQNNIFKDNISSEQIKITEQIIDIFDNKFKYHLDRYKYSNRYENADKKFHQKECLDILIDLEKVISDGNWFFGNELNKLDISILPFLRQFRIADPHWFDSLKQIPKIQKLLYNFLDSNLLNQIMFSYEVWGESSEISYLIRDN